MPKFCAIALTLICLIATVADTPGVSLLSGPALMDEPPAATAPLEVVAWPNGLLASDPTTAHPVEHATWAPLAMNAADALELEGAHAQDFASVSEEFPSGSVGGPNYDHPTLSFRFGTSMRARGSHQGASGSGASAGTGGGGTSQEEPSKGDDSAAAPTDPSTGDDDAGSGPTVPTGDVPTGDGPTDNAPADGGSPAHTDDQPNTGNTSPEGPGDSTPPVAEAPPSNTETPSEAPPADDGSPAPGEEPHEAPSDTPPTPAYPSYPIDDVPGVETPIEVPEPSSLGLLGIGLAGLFARRRRRAH